jgi:sigma-B regulation protein RsbU (phosphoserine phosphatase)
MQTNTLHRLRDGLARKRDILAEWLHTTARGKKEVLLGPASEAAVRVRLEVLDGALAKADSQTLGKCELCHEAVEPELLEVDYTARVCLEHLSGDERRQLERELELAQAVQKMLLPQAVPRIPGFEIAAFSRPAQIVGGDYFDFIDFGSGAHGLIIADVAGHGVAASLHMAGIQALLRTLVPLHRSPAEVMRQVHKLFIHNSRFDTFVTFFIGALDASSRTFTFCNAGHQPPLVVRQNGGADDAPEALPPTAAAVGLVEDALFAERTIALEGEDLLVMYTDGVTEAVNRQDQAFGRERLGRLARQAQRKPVQAVVQDIRQDLEEFCQGMPLTDDTTLVIGKVV